MTNNLAEYTAVIQALVYLYRKGFVEAKIYSDSLLVVNQGNGKWEVRAAHLKPLADRVQRGLAHVGATLHWVPREQNREADRLCTLTYARRKSNVRICL